MAKLKVYKTACLVLAAAGLTATSCIKFEEKDNNETADTLSVETTAAPPVAKQEITGPVYVYNDIIGLPEKSAPVSAQNASPAELTETINKYTGKGQVVLEYIKTSNDTVFVRISDSSYLTRQMGTLGSHAYMATVTYTLTEAAGINHVDFEFEEGDHAAPGTYNRESFKPMPIN